MQPSWKIFYLERTWTHHILAGLLREDGRDLPLNADGDPHSRHLGEQACSSDAIISLDIVLKDWYRSTELLGIETAEYHCINLVSSSRVDCSLNLLTPLSRLIRQ